MSEETPPQRHKGYPSAPIKNALEDLLLLKPEDPFKFLARYFQHFSHKSQDLYLSFQLLTNDLNSFDSAVGEAFILLSRDSLSGVQIKDVLGLCSFFHSFDKNFSINSCQKYLGYIYKQYSSKECIDFLGFKKIAEFHCVLLHLGQALNDIFKSRSVISGLDLKNILLKYQNFNIGIQLLRIPISDQLNQNQVFNQIDRILRE